MAALCGERYHVFSTDERLSNLFSPLSARLGPDRLGAIEEAELLASEQYGLSPVERVFRSDDRPETDRLLSELLLLPAVRLSRISPPRGGEYLHEVTAGSISVDSILGTYRRACKTEDVRTGRLHRTLVSPAVIGGATRPSVEY